MKTPAMGAPGRAGRGAVDQNFVKYLSESPNFVKKTPTLFSFEILGNEMRDSQLYKVFSSKGSGVPTPLFRGSTPRRVGVRGSSPGIFFSFKVAEPLKFNSQAARFTPTVEYANKTKAYVDGSTPAQIDHGS